MEENQGGTPAPTASLVSIRVNEKDWQWTLATRHASWDCNNLFIISIIDNAYNAVMTGY